LNVDEFRPAPKAASQQLRDLDIEPDQCVGPRRIRFDKRCAAFRITRPAKNG
jgi:hypothetical protein